MSDAARPSGDEERRSVAEPVSPRTVAEGTECPPILLHRVRRNALRTTLYFARAPAIDRMALARSRMLPAVLAFLVVAVALTPTAGADVLVSLTVHETPEAPASTAVPSCAFWIRGEGLLAETGRLLVYEEASPDLVLASVPFVGTPEGYGTYAVLAGPVTLASSHAGLRVVTAYENPEIWTITSAPFSVDCGSAIASAPCEVSAPLPPIAAPGHARLDGSHRFELGSTIPVRLRVLCDGVAPAVAPRLFLSKLDGGLPALEQAAPSTSHPGSAMRWIGHHWHHELDTRSLTAGTWRLRVEVGDGTEHATRLSLV